MDSIVFSKSIPIRYSPDIAVFGGGIAGVCAACVASKLGKQVLLVEQMATLGGMSTNGGVAGFCGENSGQGFIFDEISSDLEKFNAIEPYFPGYSVFFKGRQYHPEILKYVLQELVLRYKVKVLFHTHFVDAVCVPNKKEIDYVLIHGKSGIEAVKSKMYIDCTGEADLIRAAGGDTMKGDNQTGFQLPMALNFVVKNNQYFPVHNPIPTDFVEPPLYLQRNQLPMNSVYHLGVYDKIIKVKLPKFDSTNTESLSQAEIQGRRRMMKLVQYHQHHGIRKWELKMSFPIIGIREGCRIVGEYVLSVEDVRAGKTFPDGVAVGTYVLDAHKPDDDFRTYILPKDQLKVPPYQIPLRSLIPKGFSNILVAGRNLSADQLAMSSARVITSCAMMGHAAGCTAAMSIDKQLPPLQIAIKCPKDIQTALENLQCKLDLAHYHPK